MIDHMTVLVSDFERSKAFYQKALAPLGYVVCVEFSGGELPMTVCGLGVGGKPDLWLRATDVTLAPTHIALRAETMAQVDAFYVAAMAAGGRDHGAPGPRPEYHPGYYGGFVLDPDGNNLEAVIHDYRAH